MEWLAIYLIGVPIAVYLDGRFSDNPLPPVWLLWPITAPLYALSFALCKLSELGTDHAIARIEADRSIQGTLNRREAREPDKLQMKSETTP